MAIPLTTMDEEDEQEKSVYLPNLSASTEYSERTQLLDAKYINHIIDLEVTFDGDSFH